MEAFDLYGFQFIDLETARHQVGLALEVEFSPRDNSSYGLYYLAKRGPERITLHENVDAETGQPFAGYPAEMKVLLHIEHTTRSDEYRKLLIAKVRGIAQVWHQLR